MERDTRGKKRRERHDPGIYGDKNKSTHIYIKEKPDALELGTYLRSVKQHIKINFLTSSNRSKVMNNLQYTIDFLDKQAKKQGLCPERISRTEGEIPYVKKLEQMATYMNQLIAAERRKQKKAQEIQEYVEELIQDKELGETSNPENIDWSELEDFIEAL